MTGESLPNLSAIVRAATTRRLLAELEQRTAGRTPTRDERRLAAHYRGRLTNKENNARD